MERVLEVLKTTGIYVGIILLFTIKYLALLFEYLFKQLKDISEEGLNKLQQTKEELNETNGRTEMENR